MTVKTGTAWAGTFVTQDATGALATPSAGPAGVLYVDGTANAATVTITGSNPYKFAVTLPSLTAGQRVDMYITATIATIATAGIVASEQADTFIVSDIETLVDGLETMLTDIHDTDLPAIKTETAAILEDTGTDGVVLKAAGLAADAVTKIQAGLALEATLTAIADAISALNDPTPQQVWEYATRSLSTPSDYKADVSGLATTAHVQEVEDKVDNLDGDVADVFDDVGGIKTELDLVHAKTNNLPASPAPANEYDARMAAIQADLDNPAQYKADVSGVPEAVMTAIVEGAISLRDSLKLANAALAGKASGGGTGEVTFRDLADTLDRIIATVDEDNNRLSVTVDLS